MLATVPPIKTPLGQQELRRRTGGLGQRHRTLLFLIDGRRPLSEVLVLGHKAGAATSHLEDLIRLGFVDVPALHPAEAASPPPPADVPAQVTYVEMEIPAGPVQSQWGALDAEAPVPVVQVFREPVSEEMAADEALPQPEATELSDTESEAAWSRAEAQSAEPEVAPGEVSDASTVPQPQLPEHAPAAAEQTPAERPAAVVAQIAAPEPVPAPASAPLPMTSKKTPAALMPLEFPPEPAFTSTSVVSAVVAAPTPVPSPAPAERRPLPAVLQRMAMMARRPPAHPKDPVDEARDCLLRVIKLDRTTMARRLRPRVVNAKTEGTLIDVVWELERDLTHGQRSHEGLIALQRARELLHLGNTLVDEEIDASGMLHG
jgi:hypothetical protein